MTVERINVRVWFSVFSLTLAVGLFSAGAAVPKPISGARILVGDLVPRCKETSCSIEVGPAPLPGRSRVVRRQEVVKALKDAGHDSRGLNIPLSRRVLRPAKKVSKEELKNRISKAVVKVLPKGFVLESLGKVNGTNVPKDGFDVTARWPGDERFRRRVSIQVDLTSDGTSFRTMQIAATLSLNARLPVAARYLDVGTIVDAHSYKWSSVRLTEMPAHLARSPSEIIGRRISRVTEEGKPFKSRDLERIPVIMRGQRLNVVSIRGLVRVRTSGVARQDGAVGDVIRVIVQPAGRLLFANVTAPGFVEVTP